MSFIAAGGVPAFLYYGTQEGKACAKDDKGGVPALHRKGRLGRRGGADAGGSGDVAS